MAKPEELTCPRKHTNCHPLDLIASGDAFTCCGSPDPALGVLPFCVCMIEPGKGVISYYSEIQLLKMVSVVTRALASVRE